LNYKYFISKRYLFSKKDSKFVSFITYISILGISLGVATLIIAVSILNGFEKEIREKVSGLVSHIQISSFKPEGLSDYKNTISIVKENIPGIKSIAPFIQKEAVIRFKGTIEGIMLKGIDGNTDLSSGRTKIIAGSQNLDPIDSTFSRLIIGDKLATKLGIKIDDKVIVFGLKGIPSPVNQPKIKQFRISGIYESGLREYDDLLIYTDIATTQKLFNMDSLVTAVELSINDSEKINETTEEIRSLLRYPHYTRSLYQLYRELFTWVALQQAPTPIILGLIIIVASFNIIGTLLMLVLEKTQSIGILKSLGCKGTDIMKIFIIDGMIIGILGIIIGNILGIGLSLLELQFKFFKLPEQYYMKNVPILLKPELILLISLITVVLIFLATIIPAYIASRFDPVKSIRFS